MWVPRTLRGGAELAPLPSLQILEEVSYGDPSAGWVLMAASLATGTGGAYLGDEAVAQLFGHERLPVIAGQGTRPGTATPVAGGFRLTGSWSFASGIKHASHIHTLGVVPDTGEARIFVLPGDAGHADRQLGRAGAARDRQHRLPRRRRVRARGVHAPRDHRVAAARRQPVLARRHRLRHPVPLRRGRPASAAACSTSSPAKCGRGVGRSGTLAASEAFHEQYAKAEGKYRAARALVREAWSDVSASLDAGTPLTVRQHTLIRLALANITWSCHEVTEFAYTAAGTVALRAGTIQRLFRDMHAGTQHITSAPPVIRNAGRELAGLAGGKKWLFLDLVDQA